MKPTTSSVSPATYSSMQWNDIFNTARRTRKLHVSSDRPTVDADLLTKRSLTERLVFRSWRDVFSPSPWETLYFHTYKVPAARSTDDLWSRTNVACMIMWHSATECCNSLIRLIFVPLPYHSQLSPRLFSCLRAAVLANSIKEPDALWSIKADRKLVSQYEMGRMVFSRDATALNPL